MTATNTSCISADSDPQLRADANYAPSRRQYLVATLLPKIQRGFAWDYRVVVRIYR